MTTSSVGKLYCWQYISQPNVELLDLVGGLAVGLVLVRGLTGRQRMRIGGALLDGDGSHLEAVDGDPLTRIGDDVAGAVSAPSGLRQWQLVEWCRIG